MLFIQKIKFKNILSSGNQYTEIDFTSTKTTLVKGNSGQGKSLIITALIFGLYGKSNRSTTKKQLVNSTNKKDCLVEVYFSVDGKKYLVRRGISPNIFEIYINGKLQEELSAVKDCATAEGTYTIIGDKNLLLAYSHIAHECLVGNHLVMSSHAALGGHVQLGDRVNIGWGAGLHQFCRVGDYAMVGAASKVVQDVPPYMIADGSPAMVRTTNKVAPPPPGPPPTARCCPRRARRWGRARGSSRGRP